MANPKTELTLKQKEEFWGPILKAKNGKRIRVVWQDISSNRFYAYKMLNWLRRHGLASQVGFAPRTHNNGRPPIIWEIPESIIVTFGDSKKE